MKESRAKDPTTAPKPSEPIPTRGLWRRFLILVPLVAVLAIVSFVHVRSVGGDCAAWTFLPPSSRQPTAADVTFSAPGVAEVVSVTQGEGGFTRVTFRAVTDGKTEATLRVENKESTWSLDVRDGIVVEGGVNFSGWKAIHISVCVLLGVLVVLFANALVRLWRASWYGYTMVACGGALLYCLFQFALFLTLLLRGSTIDFSDLVSQLVYAADWFVMLTFLPMGLLSLLVSASNISLIRHEGLRPVNLLGIAVSLTWAAANIFFFTRAGTAYAYLAPYKAAYVFDTLVATAITYGECLLLATILCAWLASRHVPDHGADYLIVLGCGLREDGTPSPLLAGRVDRALAFDEARVAAGDAPTTFVPSGGQGPDEVVSEAEGMAGYLVAHGVPRERIALEGRSATTRENMAFSREVIERHAGCDASELSVAFSTTNYHVFRGYVSAHEAGMRVEGMGSRTRAYFWPNAFLREFAGLLAAQWKTILQVYLILAAIYGVVAYAHTLM
ncbi:MAG: YdcF family protein [Olsenella sp.]|nr:YdcF family protein [Olsenella sp.]